MLIPYDPFRDFEENDRSQPEPLTDSCHYATEVAEMLHCHSLEDIAGAIGRAMQVCEQAGFAVPVHFRHVFRPTGEGLQRDVRLSSLASYLVIINAGTEHEAVAKAQIIAYFKKGN